MMNPIDDIKYYWDLDRPVAVFMALGVTCVIALIVLYALKILMAVTGS
jgi:hypothetical protein